MKLPPIPKTRGQTLESGLEVVERICELRVIWTPNVFQSNDISYGQQLDYSVLLYSVMINQQGNAAWEEQADLSLSRNWEILDGGVDITFNMLAAYPYWVQIWPEDREVVSTTGQKFTASAPIASDSFSENELNWEHVVPWNLQGVA